MNMVAFDTLKLARKLRDAGMPAEQAEAVAAAQAEAFGGFIMAHLATKDDIAEVKEEIAGLRAEVKEEIAEVRQEIAGLRGELYRALLMQTFAVAGIMFALLKLVD